jgi:hypothetical protein
VIVVPFHPMMQPTISVTYLQAQNECEYPETIKSNIPINSSNDNNDSSKGESQREERGR